MVKVLILGATGLLGSTLIKYFSNLKNIRLYGVIRSDGDKNKFKNIKKCEFFCINLFNKKLFLKIINEIEPNFIINCCGVVKQVIKKKSNYEIHKINAYLPKFLNNLIYKKKNTSIIHFTSDCVFNGLHGNYSEKDKPNSTDIYGISKTKGEVKSKKVLNIRTSLIGHEIKSKHSLLEWFLKQKLYVKGFHKAFFSGLTALEIAKILYKYVIFKKKFHGIFNLSGPKISKYELLKIINRVYKLKKKIIPSDKLKIDRSLNCNLFKKKTGYKKKSWEKTIKEMYTFHNNV